MYALKAPGRARRVFTGRNRSNCRWRSGLKDRMVRRLPVCLYLNGQPASGLRGQWLPMHNFHCPHERKHPGPTHTFALTSHLFPLPYLHTREGGILTLVLSFDLDGYFKRCIHLPLSTNSCLHCPPFHTNNLQNSFSLLTALSPLCHNSHNSSSSRQGAHDLARSPLHPHPQTTEDLRAHVLCAGNFFYECTNPPLAHSPLDAGGKIAQEDCLGKAGQHALLCKLLPEYTTLSTAPIPHHCHSRSAAATMSRRINIEHIDSAAPWASTPPIWAASWKAPPPHALGRSPFAASKWAVAELWYFATKQADCLPALNGYVVHQDELH